MNTCSDNKAARTPVTLVVTDGRVWTGHPNQPWAQALAVSGANISAVGSNAEILRLAGKTTAIIQAGGQMVIPGFIDAHIHLITGGLRLASVQLRDARTPAEFIDRIRQQAQSVEPGTWITGGGWDHEQWGGELPQRGWIDTVTPNNPVWVNRMDGHMALANSVTLEIARVDRNTPAAEGGTIVLDNTGEPTGILKDNSMVLVDQVVPEPSPETVDRALDAALNHVAEQGVTSVHHMGGWDDLEAFQRAQRQGRLRTRIYAAVPLSTWGQLQEKIQRDGQGDNWLKIGALKGFVDGSLGSHTAAFFEPYADAPQDSGLLVNTPEDLYRWISAADKAGRQLMIHAIGDRANNILLNIFKRVQKENGPRDRRFRIEHAQHLTAGDFSRFKKLEVIASMQPYHAIDDGRWAEKVIGSERCKTTYAFRSLLTAGVRLAFGSDWFVAPPTPVEGIYAAVTRRTLDGENPDGWIPEQKISVEDALRVYTINAAYASFEEDIKGSLEPGKLADFVIIDRDLTTIPPEQIKDARVLITVIGGQVVFDGRN